jgi:hypothetical protein
MSEHQAEPLPERGENGRFLPRPPGGSALGPGRSPERQKLAEAIERLNALDTQLQRLAEARDRLDWHDKRRAHEAAQRALEEARRRAPELLVARAMGEEFDPALTVAHAQGLVEDAAHDLAEAAAAAELLRDEIQAVEQRRSLAQHARDDAVTAVVRGSPELAAFCARVSALRQELYNSTWACSAIGLGPLPRNFWDGVLWGPDRGSGALWKAAKAALASDADAELPSDPQSE